MFKEIIKKILPNFAQKRIISLILIFSKNLYEFFLKYDCKICMKLLGFKKCEVVFLDSIANGDLLRDSSKSDIYIPILDDNEAICEQVKVPEVKLYSLANVLMNIKSSNFVQNKKVLIERIPSIELKYCNYTTGIVLAHNSQFAILKKKQNSINLNVRNAIYLGGNGSWNYYHWMIEILPKIQLIQESGILSLTHNIIVSETVRETDSFMKTLQHTLKGQKVNLLFLEQNIFYNIENLYVISSPSNILFNAKITITSPKYNFFRMESLEYVRTLVLEMVQNYNQDRLIKIINKLKNKENKLNIFLSRKEGSKRDYNQDEV